jgi:hypothetical protein
MRCTSVSVSSFGSSTLVAPMSSALSLRYATFDPEWNAYVAAPGAPFAQLELYNLNELVSLPASAELTFRVRKTGAELRCFGPLTADCPAPERIPRYHANVITGETYELDYDAGVPRKRWARAFALTLQFSAPDQPVLVSLPVPAPTTTSFVEVNGVAAPLAPTLAALKAGPANTFFYDAAAEQLWIKLACEAGGSGTSVFDGLRTTFVVLSL